MIKKKLRPFILALVFLGTLLSSFHYHDDMQMDDNCPICIIQHVIAIADIPELFSLQELIVLFAIPLWGKQNYYSLRLIPNPPSRAPPSFF